MATQTKAPETPLTPARRRTRAAAPVPNRRAQDGLLNLQVLASSIGCRPEIADLVLREANSALHGPVTPVEDVRTALLRLGLDRVRQIVRGQVAH